MPLMALYRFRSHLSKTYFYNFGVQSVNKAAYTLFFTLLFICLTSYSTVQKYTSPIRQSTTDFIDGYAWQFSPHIQLTNLTLDSHFIIQQLYITNDQHSMSKGLFNDAFNIYTSLTTSSIDYYGKTVSLQDVCAPFSPCLVHSPLLYWDNNLELIQNDLDIIKTIDKQMHNTSSQQLPLHPFTTLSNITFDNQKRFQSAESLLMTILLKRNSLDMWDALWQNTVKELNLTQKRLNIPTILLQFKLSIVPPITVNTAIVILCAVGIFVYIRLFLSQSHLFKSRSGLGITILFSSMACYTSTMGVFDSLHVDTRATPWFIRLSVCTLATLEHALLLTGVVASRKKDISVKERMGKGYQQAGILMTSTLIGELVILAIGSVMNINNVKSFCIFSSVALSMAYVLNLTLYTAILSIDIKRADLTDLENGDDDDKTRKYGHHTHHHDYTFKTKRAINALFLCFILLYLSVFNPKGEQAVQIDPFQYNQLISISNQFWHIVNPFQENISVEIQPITAVFINEDEQAIEKQIIRLTEFYNEKLHTFRAAIKEPRGFDLSPLILFLLKINIPNVMLLIIFFGILMWMVPYIREQILLPLLRKMFIRGCMFILRIISKITPLKIDYLIQKVEREYNEDGVHIGAISMQSQFNMSQNENNVKNIEIQTLLGKHVADISALTSQGKKVISVDQDGKIILWNSEKGEWMARLDHLIQVQEGYSKYWVAEKNLEYYNTKRDITMIALKRLPRARCVKVDMEGRWGIAGFENGTVCVWDLETAQLVHELSISKVKEILTNLSSNNSSSDRVIQLLFLENSKTTTINSNKKIAISVHKNGIIREWDIIKGEMTQNIISGHMREITDVFILPNNQQSNHFFILTSSKDGLIKCWQRNQFHWGCKYVIQEPSEITSIAAQQLHNGMGILVSGSVDNAVKVWDINSGDVLCTLSKANTIKKEIPEAEVGGPLLQFSKVSESNDDRHNAYINILKQSMVISNHNDAVCQVVVTRVGNPEFENDCCPSCNTTINSGFFVASCSLDYTVHTWRLDRTELGKNAGCTECLKDYHRQQHYNRTWNHHPEDRYPAGPVSKLRSQQRRKLKNFSSGDESESNNNQQTKLSLRPLFLGKLANMSSHSLIFCENMVLAGVRRHCIQSESESTYLTEQDNNMQWEAWFASLQYYEPPSLQEDASLIPVITFNLELDTHTIDILSQQKEKQHSTSFWDTFLLHVFKIKKVRSPANKPTTRSNNNKQYDIANDDKTEKSHFYYEHEEYEAFDILPFSAIRQVVPTNGYGLCCDYGNFIKIVSFEDPTSSSCK